MAAEVSALSDAFERSCLLQSENSARPLWAESRADCLSSHQPWHARPCLDSDAGCRVHSTEDAERAHQAVCAALTLAQCTAHSNQLVASWQQEGRPPPVVPPAVWTPTCKAAGRSLHGDHHTAALAHLAAICTEPIAAGASPASAAADTPCEGVLGVRLLLHNVACAT